MSLFPANLPAAGNAVASDTLAESGHTARHNAVDDEALAIATKVGLGAATPGANTVLRGTGAGTSTWGAVVLTSDVTGALPVANGGTAATSAADARTNLSVYSAAEVDAAIATAIATAKAALYPVGSLYYNATVATNPATLLGFGTWAAFGAGKVPVGYDGTDSDFNAGEKTGGAKTVSVAHTHTINHTHTIVDYTAGGQYPTIPTPGYSGNSGAMSANATASVVQPYITVFIWKRTA